MIGGAAREDGDAPDFAQLGGRQADAVQHDPPVRPDAGGHRGGQRRRLLQNLFDHEVGVPALFRAGHVPVDQHLLLLHRPAALVEHPRPVPCQANHLAVRQLEDPPGVRQHGGDIGRDEVTLLRQPDNQRAGTTHRDDLVRMLGAQHPQGVGTLQPGDGRPHRGGEIPGIRLFDEVGDDLGVRLGKERHPFILQLLFQHGVVLDDPVVHHGEPPA